ncbi:MAG: acyl transferase [Bacteroidota bacterium]
MVKAKQLKKRIFNIKTQQDFIDLTLDIFNYQYHNNDIYRLFIQLIGCNPNSITHINEIPFLPIEFFKQNKIVSGKDKEKIIFLSSGTTDIVQSKHYITDLEIYKTSFIKSFNIFFGNPEKYTILALLPNYLEREGSSLVFMVNELIKRSNDQHSGFYLHNYKELLNKISDLRKSKKKILLIGVSYALLDLPISDSGIFENVIIMETGGMKGKRKEMTKNELHKTLQAKYNVGNINSEYGMTELLSQAYSTGKGLFSTPPWMKVIIRDTYDPFSYLEEGRSGGINIIDLANLNSCSFIETKDIGKLKANNQFEVLGRFDNSDIRGCNLLIG